VVARPNQRPDIGCASTTASIAQAASMRSAVSTGYPHLTTVLRMRWTPRSPKRLAIPLDPFDGVDQARSPHLCQQHPPLAPCPRLAVLFAIKTAHSGSRPAPGWREGRRVTAVETHADLSFAGLLLPRRGTSIAIVPRLGRIWMCIPNAACRSSRRFFLLWRAPRHRAPGAASSRSHMSASLSPG